MSSYLQHEPEKNHSTRSGAGIWLFCAVLTLCMVALPSPAETRTPARKRCAEATAKSLLKKARPRFPGIKLRAWRGCLFFGDTKQVSLSPFEYRTHKRLYFYVRSPMVLGFGKRRSNALDLLSRKRRARRKKQKRFMVVPFESLKQMRRTASRLLANPILKRAFGNKKLYCSASNDAPGSCAYYFCSPRKKKRSAIGLSMKRVKSGVVFQHPLRHPCYGGVAKKPVVYKYALPVRQLHPKAVRWRQARTNHKVKAFLKRYPGARVDLESWHQHYLVLTPPKQPKQKLVVVFERPRRRRTPQILSICQVSDPMKCVYKARKIGAERSKKRRALKRLKRLRRRKRRRYRRRRN